MKYLPETLRMFHQTFFVLDYSSKRYEMLTQSNGLEDKLSDKKNGSTEGCLDFFSELIKEDDILLMNAEIFTEVSTFLSSQPSGQASDYFFTYTYRVQTLSGKCLVVMQKCKYIIDENTGMPLFTFGLVIDVSFLKKGSSLIFMIDKCIGRDKLPMNILKKTYFPQHDKELLTNREREVLLWIIEGLSSKMIAHKIQVSKFTVDNHRKALLKKTNTENIAGLIRYAMDNGFF